MRFQLTDLQAILGMTPDVGVNTPKILTADFVGMRLNSQQPPLPELQRNPDTMIGDGTERAMRLRRGWWTPRQITVGGQLNTETAARLGSRNLSGTRTATLVVAGVYDVVTAQQTKAQGRMPQLSTLGFLLGGYDFLWPSMAVNSFEIAFSGDNDVNFTANLINTGFWRRMADIVPAIVPPDPPTHHLMHPAATRVTFSNGTVIDYAAEGDLIEGACSNNNNIVVRQLPGDPFIDPLVRTSGAYARDIHRGRRDPAARLKVAMDNTLAEFTLSQSGADITSLTYLFVGEQNIGATTYSYEYEWRLPLCEIEAVAADPDGDDAAISMSFYPKKDAVTGGYVVQRVRTPDNALQ